RWAGLRRGRPRPSARSGRGSAVRLSCRFPPRGSGCHCWNPGRRVNSSLPCKMGRMTAPAGLLDAARSGDASAFEQLVAPYRADRRACGYRMCGALHDAEYAVQESLVRPWRSVDSLDERGFVRAWLYKIATNRCLTAIDQRARRDLPVDVTPGPPTTETSWLEPSPGASPEEQYLARE